jgi:hypothetical protein
MKEHVGAQVEDYKINFMEILKVRRYGSKYNFVMGICEDIVDRSGSTTARSFLTY